MEQLPGLIFLALPLLLIWMIFARTRRQQRTLAAAQAAIRPGLWVMTTSGLHGQVVSVDGTSVLLEVAPGVHTRWARLAVAEVFDQDPITRASGEKVVDLTSDSPENVQPDDRDDRKLN